MTRSAQCCTIFLATILFTPVGAPRSGKGGWIPGLNFGSSGEKERHEETFESLLDDTEGSSAESGQSSSGKGKNAQTEFDRLIIDIKATKTAWRGVQASSAILRPIMSVGDNEDNKHHHYCTATLTDIPVTGVGIAVTTTECVMKIQMMTPFFLLRSGESSLVLNYQKSSLYEQLKNRIGPYNVGVLLLDLGKVSQPTTLPVLRKEEIASRENQLVNPVFVAHWTAKNGVQETQVNVVPLVECTGQRVDASGVKWNLLDRPELLQAILANPEICVKTSSDVTFTDGAPCYLKGPTHLTSLGVYSQAGQKRRHHTFVNVPHYKDLIQSMIHIIFAKV